jgi:hypothetical protein
MAATRSEIREALFSNIRDKAKSKNVILFGQEIELRQPSLGTILDAQQEPDRKKGMVHMLVNYAYVPGTDEHVFEEGDYDDIMQLPFGDDLTRLQTAIGELTGINVEEARKNSSSAPDGSTS